MLIVPTVVLPPTMPFTLHVTEALVVPVTEGVNCWVWPVRRVTELGDTVTPTTARIVTGVVSDLVGSATLVAVTFTVDGLGTMAGAV